MQSLSNVQNIKAMSDLIKCYFQPQSYIIPNFNSSFAEFNTRYIRFMKINAKLQGSFKILKADEVYVYI
jgi:hypothetical protein